MGIGDEDVKRIGEYVKPFLRDMVREAVHTEVVQAQPQTVGPQLLERMVRVEEELKAQRELMKERFDFIADRFAFGDRRFEQDQKSMDRRFESVDKRFESVDKRFDDMQESFKRTQWLIGMGFVLLTAVVSVFGVFG